MVGKTVFVGLRLFLVFLHILVVEAFDLEDIDGDASFVAVARPLRVLFITSSVRYAPVIPCVLACWVAYHQPGLLVCLDVKMVIKFFYSLILQPLLGVGELAICAGYVELAGS